MAKLKNPLLSLGAIGRLTKDLALRRSRKTNIIEKKPIPHDVKSPAQLEWRHMYQKAITLWHALSPAEKQEWESLARPRHMTGFAWFMSQCLRPNPGIYLPLQGGTMQGDINMAKYRILELPLPTDGQHPANKTYVDTEILNARYFEGARVYHDVDQAIPNTAWTAIAFNSQRWDSDAIHDPLVNNSRLTAKTAGIYIVVISIAFSFSPTGLRQLMIRVNATDVVAYIILPAIATERTQMSVSTICHLAVGSFVDTRAYQSSGAPLNIDFSAQHSPEFMMQRLSY